MLTSASSHALIPLEGIVFGNVEDIKQYDPFSEMLSSLYYQAQGSDNKKLEKLNFYIASYKQGYDLMQSCNSSTRVTYSTSWQKDSAKRSVAAGLQYIGLDLALKSIANYAKKLNYSEEKYKTLYTNLVTNTCSQNLTVYSHKMLLNNFKYFWKNETGFENPSIAGNPYFDNYIQQYHETKDSIEKSLYFSVLNFRGLCSWNSDVENFALMAPYIKNPFIMSMVFNNLSQQKLKLDSKTGQALLVEAEDGVQVACENMICRKTDSDRFVKLFPRIDGSDNLYSDLKLLYCNHLQNSKISYSTLPDEQKKWVDSQGDYVKKIEGMHLFSLFTGIPEFLVTAEKFTDVMSFMKNNIKHRWDIWSESKTNKFNLEQLYEEPLEVTLVEYRNRLNLERGKFQVNFSVTLGEIDKMIDNFDEIDIEFNLSFEKRYLAYYR